MSTVNAMTALLVFFGRQAPRLFLEHHRNAVAYRIREARGLRHELLLVAVVHERPLGHGAHEKAKQLGIHGSCAPRRRRVTDRRRRGSADTRSARPRTRRILPRPSGSSGSRARRESRGPAWNTRDDRETDARRAPGLARATS